MCTAGPLDETTVPRLTVPVRPAIGLCAQPGMDIQYANALAGALFAGNLINQQPGHALTHAVPTNPSACSITASGHSSSLYARERRQLLAVCEVGEEQNLCNVTLTKH